MPNSNYLEYLGAQTGFHLPPDIFSVKTAEYSAELVELDNFLKQLFAVKEPVKNRFTSGAYHKYKSAAYTDAELDCMPALAALYSGEFKQASYLGLPVRTKEQKLGALLRVKLGGIIPIGSVVELKKLKNLLDTGKIRQLIRRTKKYKNAIQNHVVTGKQLKHEYSLTARPEVHEYAKTVKNTLWRLWDTIRGTGLNITRSYKKVPEQLNAQLGDVVEQAQSQGLKGNPTKYFLLNPKEKSTGKFIATTTGGVLELPYKWPMPQLRATTAHELGHAADAEKGIHGLTTGTIPALKKFYRNTRTTAGRRLKPSGARIATNLQSEFSANEQTLGTMGQVVNQGKIPVEQIAAQNKATNDIVTGSRRSHIVKSLEGVSKLPDKGKTAYQKRLRKSPFLGRLSPEAIDPPGTSETGKLMPKLKNIVSGNFDMPYF
jgi:hypothetical protein